MKRREFLLSAAATAAAVAGVARPTRAQKIRTVEANKLKRVALMTLNFSSMLKLPNNANGTLDVLDIAEMYADTYGVHNIELQHSHIVSTEDSYLREMRARYAKFGAGVTNINLEFGGMNISADDPVMRAQAIDLTCKWVDHAVVLGSPRVMINQGQPTDTNKVWGIPTLKAMGDYGRSKGIMVSVETRGNGQTGGARGSTFTLPGRGGAPAAAAPAARGGNVTITATVPPVQGAAGAPGAAGAAGARGGGGGGRGGQAPAPELAVIPAWVLLAELIKNSGTYANVDMGNVGAQTQGELHAALRALLPMTVDNTHTRVSPYWDLATVVKFMTVDLGYKGLFSIETNNAPGVRNVFNILVDALPQDA